MEQNEAQEVPKVRGNELQENPKGTPKGSRRLTNGARMPSIVPRRIPKGRKRRPRGARTVPEGLEVGGDRMGEFDDCYTVS